MQEDGVPQSTESGSMLRASAIGTESPESNGLIARSSNPALSKGVQTFSWGSASQVQEAQLGKPAGGRSEDHSSLSPVPSLRTGRAPGPALHHSDHTESQRLPFPSLFGDSGTGGHLLLPSSQLWAWQPCPASGRPAFTSRCGAEPDSLPSFSDRLGTYTECFFFFYSVEWDKSVVKECVASNV